MRTIFRKALAAAFGAAFLVPAPAVPGLAVAAPPCGPRGQVLEILASTYGERTVAVGVTGGHMLIEVVAAEGGETWTILIVQPDGLSCVLAVGANWRQLRPAANDPRT